MSEGARFWLLESGHPKGPFAVAELAARPGFGPQSLVCPEGKAPGKRRNWRPARRVKELAGLLPEPRRPPESDAGASKAGGSEKDEARVLLPSGAAAASKPRRAEAGAADGQKLSYAAAFRRFNPLLSRLALLTAFVCVPLALLSKRPPPFKDPLAPWGGSAQSEAVPGSEHLLTSSGRAGASAGSGPRPVETGAVRAETWGKCLDAGRFEECAASCQKTPGCRVPDAWEVCLGSGRSEQRCFDICSTSGQCKPSIEVLNRRCRGSSEAATPLICRGLLAQ